jgi:cytidine deaminase
MDNQEIQDLIHRAQKVSQQAYAPYSNFYVGSALITQKGNVFVGCNVENAAYGSTICAERNAITAAIAEEGPKMKIKVIAIIVKGER